jgi:transcriptional regulator with XRE-family HTH domain
VGQKQLTNRQWSALEALAKGFTRSAAAEAAGVSPMTLWRWLQRDHFQKALDRAYELEHYRGKLSYCRAKIAELEEDLHLLSREDTPTEQKLDIAKRLVREGMQALEWDKRALQRQGAGTNGTG